MKNAHWFLLVSFAILSVAVCSAQQGWYPHEGSLLKYRVMIRFGEEPETLPDGWSLGRVSAVAVAADGTVYAGQRGPRADPILVFDAKGKFLRSFGKGVFSIVHGLRVDPNGHVWATDTGFHQVFEFTPDGKLLRSLGDKGKPGATHDHIQPSHRHRLLTQRRFLRLRRLRQLPRGQVLTRRQVPHGMGQARHRTG